MTRAARVLAAVLLLAAGSCGAPGDDGPPPGTVRAMLTKDPASLSLIGKVDLNSERIAMQITDGLVQYDPSMRLKPRVAESWEWSDDGRTLTFHLRPGVRWHDGRSVTADDVVFTVEQVRDPLVESANYASDFEGLLAIEAEDERTVRATYDVGRPDMLEAWRVPLVPAHLAERGAALLTGAFARHPVGCGPFRFVSYAPGQEVVLAANDDYWDGRPQIDRLIFRIYPDERTAIAVMLGGGLEIMPVADARWWRETLDGPDGERLAGFYYHRLNVWHIRWNLRRPQFRDPLVRRALVHALDRDAFGRAMTAGLARVAVTSYHPSSPWTDASIEPWPFDVDEARRLLDEAGWIDADGDGVRERDGVALAFELMVIVSSQRLVDDTAAWVQESLSAVGARVRIEKVDWGLYRERRGAGEFDALLASVSSTVAPDQSVLYHSRARIDGWNFGGLDDPEVDRLLDLGRTTFDPELRRTIYYRLQARLHELQPLACLLHLPVPVIHDRRLVGVQPSPLDFWRTSGGPRTWRLETNGR